MVNSVIVTSLPPKTERFASQINDDPHWPQNPQPTPGEDSKTLGFPFKYRICEDSKATHTNGRCAGISATIRAMAICNICWTARSFITYCATHTTTGNLIFLAHGNLPTLITRDVIVPLAIECLLMAYSVEKLQNFLDGEIIFDVTNSKN